MATHTTVQSGAWSAASTWDANGVPVDNGVVVIAAGHSVEFDVDMSNAGTWPNGIAGLVITGGAVPGMLYCKYDADGTYYLKVKADGGISGTANPVKGRLLANSDGVWGNTGALPFGRKFIIDLTTTAYITHSGLDVLLYCTQPEKLYATIYGSKYAVSSVDTGTDTLTLDGAHGWAANAKVMLRTAAGGVLPAPLEPDFIYYVVSPSGATLKLAYQSGGAAIDLTTAGSGTVEVYNGHSNTSTGVVNVFDDLTADPCWTTLAGHNTASLVNAYSMGTYDDQQVTLSNIAAGALTLSANVDSVQNPGAKVVLTSRNISIRTATTTTTQILQGSGSNLFVNVYQCDLRSTMRSGSTCYGYALPKTVPWKFSGVLSGFARGCSGLVALGATSEFSGVGVSCTTCLDQCNNVIVSGLILGCGTAFGAGTKALISGTILGCSAGFNTSSWGVVSGTIAGCGTGSQASWGGGLVLTPTAVFRCNNVGFSATNILRGEGTICGCAAIGMVYAQGELGALRFYGNATDLSQTSVRGFGSKLESPIQMGSYKRSSQGVGWGECRWGSCIYDLGGVAGALGSWTLGGYCKSAAFAVGTHLTPPVAAPALIHEQTFEDSTRVCWFELPLWAPAGQPIFVTFYGRLTGTAAWLARPSVGLYDPAKAWQAVDESVVTAVMANNTDWQMLTVAYTPAAGKELRLRVQGVGGNAGGTGTEKLYWFHTLTIGGVPKVIGSPIVKGGRSW